MLCFCSLSWCTSSAMVLTLSGALPLAHPHCCLCTLTVSLATSWSSPAGGHGEPRCWLLIVLLSSKLKSPWMPLMGGCGVTFFIHSLQGRLGAAAKTSNWRKPGSFTGYDHHRRGLEDAEGPECLVWKEWHWQPAFTPVVEVAELGRE